MNTMMTMPESGSRHFRFGPDNPTIMEEPFWKYMICNPQLAGPDVRSDVDPKNLPMWCFSRFGATQTYLPDGRLICIGGEFEYPHDLDFQIYNDVVVIENPHIVKGRRGYGTQIPSNHPAAKEKLNYGEMLGTRNEKDITIYGYPQCIFPPTDSHTATYVLDKGKEFIYIIGGTGCNCGGTHKSEPCKGVNKHRENARVFRLRVSDFSIKLADTFGNMPRGCTHQHTAELLTVHDRPTIEIQLPMETVWNCSTPGWKHHDGGVYRLDIETGEWTAPES